MVFDLVLLAIALVGSSAAAIYDLKTTEVPDWLFYVMGGLGLIFSIIQALSTNNFLTLENATIFSLGLFGFGFLMYKTGQWGGADAVLLGLIGFMVPQLPSGFLTNLIFPFPISFLFNVFLIGAAYMIVYAIIFAYRTKTLFGIFSKEVKASARMLGMFSTILFFALVGITLYMNSIFFLNLNTLQIFRLSIVPIIFLIGLLLFYKFAQIIEKFGFRKKIPISKLRVGDMLMSKKELVGITPEQLHRIKKSKKKFVWIKEGVRFAPAFPLALLYTVFFGDAILLLSLIL